MSTTNRVALPTPQEIQRYTPRRWADWMGNTRAKLFLQALVRAGGRGTNLLLYGPPGSGKTTGMLMALRALRCQRLDPSTLDPCGACEPCKIRWTRRWGYGLSPHIDVFECRTTTVEEFRHDLGWVQDNVIFPPAEHTKLVFLDEAQELQTGGRKDVLLPLLVGEVPPGVVPPVWLAAATDDVHRLGPAFLRRFTLASTEPPAQEEFEDWVVDRAAEFGICIEGPGVVTLLIDRCLAAQMTSSALDVLAQVVLLDPDRRELTRGVVESAVIGGSAPP
ncbi:hypothetical protein [Planctomyces sp. SH-PL62]|uniref:hypothetical protein n=1 Tax=Planctomyces sp. SH-PL62 TaxID=1636152 RepID=UPI00078B2521|nr:hypothetical protein [Planctomyces sp. SH-PL62]AMV40483.1 DNA polymerase III subunits gamma and tau [Planctomyces sp. SH-PL62]